MQYDSESPAHLFPWDCLPHNFQGLEKCKHTEDLLHFFFHVLFLLGDCSFPGSSFLTSDRRLLGPSPLQMTSLGSPIFTYALLLSRGKGFLNLCFSEVEATEDSREDQLSDAKLFSRAGINLHYLLL